MLFCNMHLPNVVFASEVGWVILTQQRIAETCLLGQNDPTYFTLINADCLSSQSPYNFYTDHGSIETWVNEILAQNQANPVCFNDQHTTRERERDGYQRTNNFQFHAFIP